MMSRVSFKFFEWSQKNIALRFQDNFTSILISHKSIKIEPVCLSKGDKSTLESLVNKLAERPNKEQNLFFA